MLLIEDITSDPLQSRSLILEDNSIIRMTMYYMPMQYGWFIRELTYLDFTLRGFRITNNYNMFHQFRNQIPFGMACFTDGNREPTQQDDFSSEASKLYILTSDEVDEFQGYLTGQA